MSTVNSSNVPWFVLWTLAEAPKIINNSNVRVSRHTPGIPREKIRKGCGLAHVDSPREGWRADWNQLQQRQVPTVATYVVVFTVHRQASRGGNTTLPAVS